jgi:hypothetical protein
MVSLRTRFRARPARLALLAACLLAAIGCDHKTVAVTGTVTLDGNPVPGGTIYFDVGGEITSTAILCDGTYSLGLIEGETYTVTLTNPKAPNPGIIPDRYADPATSGLSLTILENYSTAITYDIKLSP